MPPKASSCPICGRDPAPETRPFCSKACRDRDLLKWLGDGYSLPGARAAPDAEKSDDYGLDIDGNDRL